MNKEENERLIVCSKSDEACWVPGSVEKEASCGHKVWMSPASVQVLNDHPESVVKCMECFEQAELLTEDIQMAYSTEQMVELRKLLPEEEIQHIISQLDMKEVN